MGHENVLLVQDRRFFTENGCLLQLDISLIKTVRLKEDSKTDVKIFLKARETLCASSFLPLCIDSLYILID